MKALGKHIEIQKMASLTPISMNEINLTP